MDDNSNSNIIDKINYKDIIIIFSIWYFFLGIIFSLYKALFQDTPYIAGFLHVLFITGGRFMGLAIFIYYFISIYSLSFRELGFKFKNLKKQLFPTIMLIIIFFFLIIIFINFPLSYKYVSGKFNPLIAVKNPADLVSSLFPLFFISLCTLIISFAEIFILSKIVFELFNYILNKYLALVLAGLFYSLLLLDLTPEKIMINFILGIILIFLYLKYEKSLLSPALFLSAFYSFSIVYIYGWDCLSF